MKRSIILGIISAFFFAFTFIMNRKMNLEGGSFLWSASLRYLFTLPMLWVLMLFGDRRGRVHAHIRRHPLEWLLWSTVGFGLFYLPLSMASAFGPSWLVAASWQITIVAGVLLTPLFGQKLPVSGLIMGCVILVGVALVQVDQISRISAGDVFLCLLTVLVAAFAYPLGNRKMMQLCKGELTALERTYGMTLCSVPFWLVTGAAAAVTAGSPSKGQIVQTLLVAFLSGVVATVLFFRATDGARDDPRHLAVTEATESFEVVFTLAGGVLFLGDAPPKVSGIAGLILIFAGMAANSFLAGKTRKK